MSGAPSAPPFGPGCRAGRSREDGLRRPGEALASGHSGSPFMAREADVRFVGAAGWAARARHRLAPTCLGPVSFHPSWCRQAWVTDVLLVASIRWGAVGPLLLISLVIMGSPGPATISLLAAGSVRGVRRSLPYLVGVIAGTTTVLLAVAAGITAALLEVPTIGPVLVG